jgi:hypothetical protein
MHSAHPPRRLNLSHLTRRAWGGGRVEAPKPSPGLGQPRWPSRGDHRRVVRHPEFVRLPARVNAAESRAACLARVGQKIGTIIPIAISCRSRCSRWRRISAIIHLHALRLHASLRKGAAGDDRGPHAAPGEAKTSIEVLGHTANSIQLATLDEHFHVLQRLHEPDASSFLIRRPRRIVRQHRVIEEKSVDDL